MGEPPSDLRSLAQGLAIVHRDDRLLAISKPSGLLVHRGWGTDERVAVEEVHALVGARVFMVHRLDRGTSGVLLFALDREAARVMGQRFERGEVWKRYVALVRGLAPEKVEVDHPLRRVDSDDQTRRPARTELHRIAATELGPEPGEAPSAWPRRYSLVEAFPKTGRTHQIRRHCKHASHPIIGDVRYGKGEHNRFFRRRFGLYRLALHASELRVRGLDDSELVLRSPLPKDLSVPLEALGLWPVT